MKILLCGMGNRDRGDDGFGPYLIENFPETNNIKKLDCSIYPENYLNKIVSSDPDLIVFFDAIKSTNTKNILLEDEEIIQGSSISVSTHNLPFSAIYEYIKENSQAKILFLGVNAKSYEIISDETTRIANRIIKNLILLDNQKKLDIINVYENLSITIR